MDKTRESPSALHKLVTIGLAILTLPLLVVVLFATQEIALTLAAQAIVSSVTDAVRGRYALVALRNLWMLFGGVLTLGLIIYSLDRLFNKAGQLSTRRYFLRLLAVELVIIGLRLAIV